MKYVDGFVIPIKKSKLKEYLKMAQWGKKTWMKYGALEYFECVGDNLKVNPQMGGLGFEKMTNLKKDETVIFSWIVYKSKAHRDAVNKKVEKEMSSPENQKKMGAQVMPWDMNRFATGGFKTIVEA